IEQVASARRPNESMADKFAILTPNVEKEIFIGESVPATPPLHLYETGIFPPAWLATKTTSSFIRAGLGFAAQPTLNCSMLMGPEIGTGLGPPKTVTPTDLNADVMPSGPTQFIL